MMKPFRTGHSGNRTPSAKHFGTGFAKPFLGMFRSKSLCHRHLGRAGRALAAVSAYVVGTYGESTGCELFGANQEGFGDTC